MNTSYLNLFGAFILPLSILFVFVNCTMKIFYSKRFIPAIALLIFAVLIFFIPFILVELDGMERDIGTGVLSVYFSGFLGLGVLANIIVAMSIKRK
ncbi:hypothetical protein ACQ0QQ_13790 [Lysinibacillus sphaericus]